MIYCVFFDVDEKKTKDWFYGISISNIRPTIMGKKRGMTSNFLGIQLHNQ